MKLSDVNDALPGRHQAVNYSHKAPVRKCQQRHHFYRRRARRIEKRTRTLEVGGWDAASTLPNTCPQASMPRAGPTPGPENRSSAPHSQREPPDREIPRSLETLERNPPLKSQPWNGPPLITTLRIISPSLFSCFDSLGPFLDSSIPYYCLLVYILFLSIRCPCYHFHRNYSV